MKVLFKKILSYIYPITEKVKSKHSGELELTLFNGKLVLDSENANYSYGSLQKILQFALQQIDLSDKENILLLGLGGGCIIDLLKKSHQYKGSITAIEIDEVVIQIAKERFGISENDKITIFCADAFQWINQINTNYDVVIVDLFIDNQVPLQCWTMDFWVKLSTHIYSKGYIIFNMMNLNDDKINLIQEKLREQRFDIQIYHQIERTNTLLIAQKQENKKY